MIRYIHIFMQVHKSNMIDKDHLSLKRGFQTELSNGGKILSNRFNEVKWCQTGLGGVKLGQTSQLNFCDLTLSDMTCHDIDDIP